MTIPIPKRPSGFLIGAPAAEITIDVFVDMQCPHSQMIWPTLLEVIAHYKNESVNLKTHLITLSNHRQAWDLSLSLFALAEGDADVFYRFATFLYERQMHFYNDEFTDKTHRELTELIAHYAEEYSGINPEQFLKRMSDHDIYIQARTPIRYAATKAVWATPTLFINNGVNVPVDHKSTLADWRDVIDPLL